MATDISRLNELASEQEQVGEEIARIARNYKKDSSVRKDLSYLQKRLQSLEEQWDKFEATDNLIRLKFGNQEHNYFSKNYYEAVRAIYDEQSKELHAKIDSLQHSYQETTPDYEDETNTTGTIKKSLLKESAKDKGDISAAKPSKPSKTPQPIAVSLAGNNASLNGNITALIRRQQSIIQTLQRTLASVKQECQAQSKQFYEIKIKTLEKYWNDVENLHHTIWEQCEDPVSRGYSVESYFTLEEEVQNMLIKLHEGLNSNPVSASNDVCVSMKLPKVELPKFDGNYLKWRQFHDLFLQMVHSQQMGDAQKMWYLKSNLTGEAERLIRHLSPSDSNYTSAWNILKARYENKRLLVTALLDKLFSQQPFTMESASALKALHDTTNECLLGLENLGISTKTWDPLLLHILTKKLDHVTHSLYEQSLEAPREIQSMVKFLNFLELRFQSLEALGTQKRTATEKSNNKTHKPTKSAVLMSTSKGSTCKLCGSNHGLFMCNKFLKLCPEERLKQVRNLRICVNCLKVGHNASKCPSRGCLKCNGKHNTLLHLNNQPISQTNSASKNSSNSDKPPSNNITVESMENRRTNLAAQSTNQTNEKYIFLASALINVQDNDGNLVRCRAILDSGSQVNLITESLCKRLKLSPTRSTLQINGIGDARVNSTQRASIAISSRINGYNTRMETYIIKEISPHQPKQFFDTTSWAIPKNIQLADPEFFKPQRVDILIGAEFFPELLSVGQIRLGENMPSLQNTIFGWIILGRISEKSRTAPMCGISNIDLDSQLQRLWTLEESTEDKPLTATERKCEEMYNMTTRRDENGRFIVRLPLSHNPEELGESRDSALRRFLSLEKRLIRQPDIKRQYTDFIKEYIELNHMEEIPAAKLDQNHYFMPHHCVLKPSSSTTRLRVVFDASSKTSNNLSLNDIMLIGPTIQDDLFSIILRFRTHKYVFSADIVKMYRQILVAPEDRRLQMIMWRESPEEPIKYYQLNTVTYGTASAPYLAVKCLQRLGELEGERYPLGALAIKDFYVDDVITGSNDLKEAIETQKQLRELLNTGGFRLRKWCANHPDLLQHIPKEDLETQLEFDDGCNSQIRTLGIAWQPHTDAFTITSAITDCKKITKRTVLADIAHIFDPLGLVNPVIALGKIFLQHLWLIKIDWDEALPQELHTQWLSFRDDFKKLNTLKIPRLVLSTNKSVNIQLHAFSDASEKAYGAALYVRTKDIHGKITSQLLCAKSRVAPTKKITLPRLELCAAKLTAQLVDRVKRSLEINFDKVVLWTDSTIVLSWISAQSSAFQTFIANRISSIQGLTQPSQWRYIETHLNPADLASRGSKCTDLLNSRLWFEGPHFLKLAEDKWPRKEFEPCCTDLERKRVKSVLTMTAASSILSSIDHKNSFTTLQRILGFILRFIRNVRASKECRNTSSNLNADEIFDALIIIMREVQGEEFSEEIKDLRECRNVKPSSKLNCLLPFLDEFGLIRVGGRLQKTTLPIDARHPIVLPYSHWVTRLLMEYIHKKHMHAGPQALLTLTRERFWPLNGLKLAQSIVHRCLTCARARPILIKQIMGNLPLERVQPARAFTNVGIDFCGPISVHYKIRGKQPTKAYIAVFVCFSTKACHLELVSDLTTAAFIGCLKRFIARRGRPNKIFSDNATNFTGARNELKELHEIVSSQQSQDKLHQLCAEEQIQWSPIPPRSPHFGGLWEAAVKSAKYHLRRVLLGAALTYEETSTVIAEVEAILNSRPLTPLSSDPNDLQALTPGHFLIGEPLTTLPNPTAKPENRSILTRWRLVTALQQEFWKRWSKEYLQQLQTRYKWTTEKEKIRLGMMVLLKEDNQPPLKWQMGRIVKTYQGSDGLIRVAEVKTASGIVKRAIHTLSPLPVITEGDTENSETSQDTNLISSNIKSANSRKRKIKILPINPNWQQNPEAMEPNSEVLQKYSRSSIQKKGEELRSTGSNEAPNMASKKTKRGLCLSTLLLTTLLCCLIPISKAIPSNVVEITPLTHNPGIYFEGLGQTSIITDEWNIIVYYDMDNYWREATLLKESITKMRVLCRPLIKYKQYCTATSSLFSHQLSTIEAANKLLQKTHDKTHRNRRSPLDLVGNIANKLFGILDEEYAQNMAQTISKVNLNENHLLELIKNQTSLIDSTVNIMGKQSEYVNNQLALADSHIKQIKEELKEIGRTNSEERILNTFNSLAIHTTLSLNEYQRIQSALTDVVTDAHRGKINSLLITPEQLQGELQLIRENLPSSLSVPGQLEHVELRQLYALMVVRTKILKNCIIFNIKLPLINKDKFEIFKVVPIPIYINSKIHRIRPASEFLAVSLHRDQYYQMSEEEFSSCTLITGGRYLCNQKHSIYAKNAGSSQCELQLLHKRDSLLPKNCIIERADDSTAWIRLTTPNYWLYAFEHDHVLNIVCGSRTFQTSLTGAGILHFKENCILKHDTFTISSHYSRSHELRSSLVPSIQLNISQFEDHIETQNAIHPELHPIHIRNNSKEINKLKKGLAELKSQQVLADINSIPVHHSIASYGAFTLSGIAIVYLIINLIRNRRPAPQPPQQEEFELPSLDISSCQRRGGC